MSVRTPSYRTVATALSAGLVATLFTASTAFAATKTEPGTVEAPAPAAAAPAKVEQGNDKRRYCVRSNPTGSRITREKCLTRAEWTALGFDVDNPEG